MTLFLILLCVLLLIAAATLAYDRIRVTKNLREVSSKLESATQDLELRMQSTQEEKKRLFAVLESMTEGVLVIGTEEKILLVNSALCRLFELKREMVERKHYWEVFRDPDVNQFLAESLKDQTGAIKEMDFLLTRTIFDVRISPVSAGGDFIGIVAVFRDVTPFKEFDRMRSEFVANVSHELKTPLTSILGFVETLKEGAIDDPEHKMKFLNIIETQSKKLHYLIEDLLFLSRIESDKEPLKKEKIRVQDLMDKIRDTFAPIVAEKKIGLIMKVVPAGLEVLAEHLSLERAVMNLVDNAIKYNSPKGSVLVEASKSSAGVHIFVKDTGMGIPESDQPRIFERFYRVDKSRARELGGTGLGLSIVKHIAERHGGSVSVESVVDQGSAFTLIIPG